MSTSTAPARQGLGQRLLRLLGWAFIGLGALLLLYLVWLLWFTGMSTASEQEDLLEEFEGFGTSATSEDLVATGDDDPTMDGVDDQGMTTSGGVGVLQFERPGEDVRPVNEDPLAIVSGTSPDVLRRGPGTYPDLAGPGEEGNFVVVGHRTTYGAPFYDIDDIQPGDLVHVTDTDGDRHTYEILEGDSDVSDGVRLVGPSDLWVLDHDPLDRGDGRYLTLISCHPRFSNAQRIIAFGELVE